MPPSDLPRSITNAREVANTPLYSPSPSRVTNHRNRDDSSLAPSTERGRVLLGLPQSITTNAREDANTHSASRVTNHLDRDNSSLSRSTESGHVLRLPRSITNAREVANMPLYSASRVTNHRNHDNSSLAPSTENGRVFLGLRRSITTNISEVANVPLYSASRVTNHRNRADSSVAPSTESGRFGLPRSMITNAREVTNTPVYSVSRVINHRDRDAYDSSLPRSTENDRVLLRSIRSIDEDGSERTTSIRTLDTRSRSAITTAGSYSTEFTSHFSTSTHGRVVTLQVPPSHFATNARGVANTPSFSSFRDTDHSSSDLHNSSSRGSTAAGRCLLELIHSLDNAEHRGATPGALGNRCTSSITISRTSQSASVITTIGSSSTEFTSHFNDSIRGRVFASEMPSSHPLPNTRSVDNMSLLPASRVTDHRHRDHSSSDNSVNNSSTRRSTAAGRFLLELIRSLDEAEPVGVTQLESEALGSRANSAVPTGGGNSSTGSTADSEVIEGSTSNHGRIASGPIAGSSLDSTSTTHANDEVGHDEDDEVVLLETANSSASKSSNSMN